MVLINWLFQPNMTGTRHIFWSFYKNNYEIKLINRNLYASAELLSDLKIRIIHVTFKTLSVLFPRNTTENPFCPKATTDMSIQSCTQQVVGWHSTRRPSGKLNTGFRSCRPRARLGVLFAEEKSVNPSIAMPNDLLCGEWDLRAFSQWQWVLLRCGLEVSRHLENGATAEWLAQKGFFPEPIAPAVLFVEGNFAHAKINRKFSRLAEWKNSCERIKM